MSHTVTVKMIADQYIEVNGYEINIHDIKTIVVDERGRIIEFYPLDKSGASPAVFGGTYEEES